ncbi:DNA-binding CsgD family transcriptional regulator [Allocatelliglobosispora scoriae]|uniref:DNA-binding CsgD family transcriptional regulator n=1 Tax=Allocatelliglobosispora scoriae TaxID=643052 RepID=A0A841BLR2_9ACTN|nr:LuxR C-terminal-related transcriptional regulator [Allocatelliglobosispora scoriae]MBB5868298.1 DNA-binding CsgD family transcriptional regulator [Allocatelliglobosispora scoriae]
MQILPLRGRDRELAAISALVERARHGRGGALLLTGEAGLGKTTLLAVAEQATAHAMQRQGGTGTLLATAGLGDEAGLPYAALQRLVEPLLDRVDGLVPHQARVLRRALTGGGCPDSDRLALCMAVLDLLGGAGPLLCLADDLHDMDPPSVEAIVFSARRLGHLPVAMLLASRDDAPAAGLTTIGLAPLTSCDVALLLNDVLDGPVDGTVPAALTRVAQGNPQAVIELAGLLTPQQRTGQAPLPEELPVDGELGRAYRLEVSRLPAETRWLLLLAAAEPGLDAGTLTRAAEACGIDVAALAPAERRGLVEVGATVAFGHPLVRTLSYLDAPLAQRRAAHRVLARVLHGHDQRLRRAVHSAAAVSGPDPVLATELEQAARGGDYTQASAALERAAELSATPDDAAARLVTAARYAWLGGHPHRARQLLTSARPVADGPAELLAGEIELRAGATATAIDALIRAADLLAGSRRDLAAAALLRAGEAACFAGDHARYVELADRVAGWRRPGDDPRLQVVYEHIAGFAATFTGEHVAASHHLQRVAELADEIGDSGPLASAAASALFTGDTAAAHRHAAKAVRIARDRGDLAALPLALSMLAYAEFWFGRYAVAEAVCLDGVAAARAGGQENYAGDHLGMLAVLAALRGERALVAQRLAEITVPPGALSRPRALGRWALAVLDILDGRPQEAVERLLSIADPATGAGHVIVQIMATPWLVEAACRAEEPERAAPALAAFDQWALTIGEPGRRALSARCHALMAPRGSEEAWRGFAEAVALHLAGEGEFERARTELHYGQELRRSRRPRDAREHLRRALEAFDQLSLPAWTEQARSELRAAGEAIATAPTITTPPATAQALTAQQLTIARLVASGATNREVADRLFLSPRTVDHHLRNIFSRLGVRSRTELARTLS